jgi:hypothetical protein
MAEIGELPSGWSTFTSGCEDCIPVAPDGMDLVATLFADPPMENATSASWSFIQDNAGGEIIYEAATNSPFPNNHQLYVSTNGVVAAASFPLNIDSNSNLVAGIADTTLFGWSSGGSFYLFSPHDDSQMTMVLVGHGFDGTAIRNWSVVGNNVFIGSEDLAVGSDLVLVHYTADPGETGLFIDFAQIADQTGMASLHFTGTFLYVLVSNSGVGTYTILKYDPDFVLVSSFVMTIATIPSVTGFIGLYAESDERIWLLSYLTSGPLGVYYVRDMMELVTVDAAVGTTTFVPAAAPYVVQLHEDQSTGIRYIYYSSSGGYPITKLGPIECAF